MTDTKFGVRHQKINIYLCFIYTIFRFLHKRPTLALAAQANAKSLLEGKCSCNAKSFHPQKCGKPHVCRTPHYHGGVMQ